LRTLDGAICPLQTLENRGQRGKSTPLELDSSEHRTTRARDFFF